MMPGGRPGSGYVRRAPGPNNIGFGVPGGAVPGPTYLRLRLSGIGGLPPTGPVTEGEVEDYPVEIIVDDGGAHILFDPDTIALPAPTATETDVSESSSISCPFAKE